LKVQNPFSRHQNSNFWEKTKPRFDQTPTVGIGFFQGWEGKVLLSSQSHSFVRPLSQNQRKKFLQNNSEQRCFMKQKEAEIFLFPARKMNPFCFR
jgi:hypothetical protein